MVLNGKTYSFWGDIGQASASAFVTGVLPHVGVGDLWITLYSERRQAIIEFQANIGEVMREGIAARLLGSTKRERKQETFFPERDEE